MDYIYTKYCHKENGVKFKNIFAIGFSLGGGLLGNFCGKEGEKCYISAACLVDPPKKLWEVKIQI